MAIAALGIVEVGLDLAVGDNTSAAVGLLCLFPMGKGFKYVTEIGGSKAKNLYKAEGLLKMDLQLFGKEEGKTIWKQVSKELVDKSIDVRTWNKGSFDSIQDSLARHFEKHGAEVRATSVEQYMRKAEGFKQNLRGAKKYPVDGTVQGVTRYIKAGKYIDLSPDGTIISFGRR
ncbi:hypothetical protein [Clostridium botulinum]|uniref:hypothetical protein n=1 Tax=Clostridium botulinum TaxID=1491 RepID=UPI000D13DC74|nr:hypothetical protein [Clostridium botulinum]AVQ47675.1 hypothetical protein C7M60_18770 [Clostridium botulinum]AVQ51222.1 hypothetical protein C7M58_18740 [Clostridium botulinum]